MNWNGRNRTWMWNCNPLVFREQGLRCFRRVYWGQSTVVPHLDVWALSHTWTWRCWTCFMAAEAWMTGFHNVYCFSFFTTGLHITLRGCGAMNGAGACTCATYLCHLRSCVSSGSQVDHGQSWADAERGDEDIPIGVCLAQSPEKLQGKICIWVADGGHGWRRVYGLSWEE